jgi:hypothetical protein
MTGRPLLLATVSSIIGVTAFAPLAGADLLVTDSVEFAAVAVCPAERAPRPLPLSEADQIIDDRTRFNLPTDPATISRAIADTAARGGESPIEVPVTDEEVDAIELNTKHFELLEPLQGFIAENLTTTGSVYFTGDFLRPLFRIQITDRLSPDKLAKLRTLTPSSVPTQLDVVQYSAGELDALLADIDNDLGGDPGSSVVVERIRSLGIEPNGAGRTVDQSVSVYVVPTDLGCDAQLTTLVANAVKELNLPPIHIEQTSGDADG